MELSPVSRGTLAPHDRSTTDVVPGKTVLAYHTAARLGLESLKNVPAPPALYFKHHQNKRFVGIYALPEKDKYARRGSFAKVVHLAKKKHKKKK